MGITNKITEFVTKYGMSYKAYFVALAAFPPACFVIAWKMQDLSNSTRIALTIVAIVIPLLVMAFGGVLVMELTTLLSR